MLFFPDLIKNTEFFNYFPSSYLPQFIEYDEHTFQLTVNKWRRMLNADPKVGVQDLVG